MNCASLCRINAYATCTEHLQLDFIHIYFSVTMAPHDPRAMAISYLALRQVPTLVVTGDADTDVPPDTYLAYVRKAQELNDLSIPPQPPIGEVANVVRLVTRGDFK